MLDQFINQPMFGILLTIAAFEIGLYIQKKTKLIFMNPLMIAVMVIIAILLIFQIDLDMYQKGGSIINLFLGPATVVLAVPLYQQLHSLKNYFIPIMIGVFVGAIIAMLSTLLCCWLFQFDIELTASLLPKSITTPIGIAVSEELGGIPAITVMSILITGIFGTIMAEVVFRFFRIQHPIAQGIALGTSAHAIGTTKAIQLGSVEGAMSSLAIGVSGIITVFLAPILWNFFF